LCLLVAILLVVGRSAPAAGTSAQFWQLTFSYGQNGLSLDKAAPITASIGHLHQPGLEGALIRLDYEVQWLNSRGKVMHSAPVQIPLGTRLPLLESGLAPTEELLIPDDGAFVLRIAGPASEKDAATVRLLKYGTSPARVAVDGLSIPSVFQAAELTFSLADTRARMAAPAAAAPVQAVKIQDTGDDANRFVIVVMGDGYTAQDLASGSFTAHARNFVDYLKTVSPWNQYHVGMNAYRVDIESNQSGADYEDASPESGGTLKDTYLNGSFWVGGTDRCVYLTGDGTTRAFNAADDLVGVGVWDEILVFVNSTKYGGCAASVAVSSVNSSANEIQTHELGHSFAGLADEYEYGGSAGTCYATAANVDCGNNFPGVKWDAWVTPGAPIPTPETWENRDLVGAFEGAQYVSTGIYRPMLDCRMRALGVEFCPVCKQAHVLKLFDHVAMADRHFPPPGPASLPEANTRLFEAVPLNLPGMRYQWYLNSAPLAGETNRTLLLHSTDTQLGTSLQLRIEHVTPLVRSASMSDTYTWHLYVEPDADGDGMPDAWETLYSFSSSNPADAGQDADGDGISNRREYERGTNPRVSDDQLRTDYDSMTLAGTFNGWNQAAANMALVSDYTWRFDQSFLNATGVRFKFVANGTWDINWGENNQTDLDLPLSGVGERGFFADILINGTVNGTYTFTFNEQTGAYSVEPACVGLCTLTEGVDEIVSGGLPGPVFGLSNGWASVASGDEDTSLPSIFAMAREYGSGRVLVFGHDGIVQNVNELDNRAFLINAANWLNGHGAQQVLFTSGHGEWVKAPQFEALRQVLVGEGYTVSEVNGVLSAGILAGHSLLFIGNAWSAFTEAEIAAIEQYVRNGGGLMMVGLGWSWNGDLDDYPMNRVAAPFGARWMPGAIVDPTHQHNGSAIFRTFHPQALSTSMQDAMDQLQSVHTAHSSGLADTLQAQPALRLRYLGAHSVLAMAAAAYPDGAPERAALHDFCRLTAQTYPQYFAKSQPFNVAGQSAMAHARERLARTWMDALPLTPSQRQIVADTLSLGGIHREMVLNHGIYLMDNAGLDQAQLTLIRNLVGYVPAALHNLRAISVTDFMGAVTPRIALDGLAGQVNIFGNGVGTVPENPFPADISPVFSDQFGQVVAHEVNHVVDAFAVNGSTELKSRKDALIAAAGAVSLNYLRSMFAPDFFVNAPQEFFASIANQWFTDSAHTFELGHARSLGGYLEPLQQALFFADVYSQGTNRTFFFRMNTSGALTRETVPILRDGFGRISVLSCESTTWFFQYDAGGKASVVKQNDGSDDTDNDNMSDRFEMVHGFNPFDAADAALDPDGDGLTNGQEAPAGAHPYKPDSDYDGIDDGADAQPGVPAYSQAVIAPNPAGTVNRYGGYDVPTFTYTFETGRVYWVTSYRNYHAYRSYLRFDLSSLPASADIRGLTLRFKATGSPEEPTGLTLVNLGALDPMVAGGAEAVFRHMDTASISQAASTLYPLNSDREEAVKLHTAFEGDLAARLAAGNWAIGLYGLQSSYEARWADLADLELIVNYERGPLLSDYSSMTVAGTFNGWNQAAANMRLVDDYVWQLDTEFDLVDGAEFKFAANGTWDINWGESNQSDFDEPMTAYAEQGFHPNIRANGLLDGQYRFTFDERSLLYTFERLAQVDSDGDGLPDYWEIRNGLDPHNYLDAMLDADGDGLINGEEYVAGTHAQRADTDFDGTNDSEDADPRASQYDQVTLLPAVQGYLSGGHSSSAASWQQGPCAWGLDAWNWYVGYVSFDKSSLPAAARIRNAVLLYDGQIVTRNPTRLEAMGDRDPTQPGGAEPAATYIRNGTGLQVITNGQYRTGGVEMVLPLNAGVQQNLAARSGQSRWSLGFGYTHQGETSGVVISNLSVIVSYESYASSYSSMSVAATFNNWNAAVNNMQLVADYTWEWVVDFAGVVNTRFKFAANGSWSVNWGDQNQWQFLTPMNDVAESGAADIRVNSTLTGTYRFRFHEQTRQYSLEKVGGTDIVWAGNTYHWPLNGEIDPQDDLWINVESYPQGSAAWGEVRYTLDGVNWNVASLDFGGRWNNNDWWHVNLGAFSAGAQVEYYVELRDAHGAVYREDRQGAGYLATVNAGQPVEWVGNVYHWPLNGEIDPSDPLWVNLESYPQGAAVGARVVYSTDEGASWYEEWMELDAPAGLNDRWHVNLGSFASGTHLEYAIEVLDGAGVSHWHSNLGLNHHALVN